MKMKKIILGMLLAIGAFSFANKKNINNIAKLTAKEAKEIAEKHSNTTGKVQKQITKLDVENGKYVYEVKLYSGNEKYEYEIDAETGAILSFDKEIKNINKNVETGKYISMERAKEIALAKVPGATEKNITELYFENDNGDMEYDITIRFNNKKYEIEIDGNTEEITSFEEKNI